MQSASSDTSTTPAGPAHVDFSRAVLEDLYRYPRRKKWLAWTLWLTTGLLGGHRFYLDRAGTGTVMLFTGGGLLVWWLIDAFLLSGMVDALNREQAHREAAGLPPLALSFMPALNAELRETALSGPPDWAVKRGGRARIAGDMLVLVIAGAALGGFTVQVGEPEPLIAVLALIGVTLLGARWNAFAHLPVLQSLDRWSHRLRLFYYTNDPGGPLSLAFRPIIGVFTAMVRKRARAETRLYLQLGAAFTIVFTILDLIGNFGEGTGLFGLPIGGLIRDTVRTMAMIYAVASPIGAILTTHLLLERRDTVIWALSSVTIAAVALGFAASVT